MKPHEKEGYENWRAYNERVRNGASPNEFEFAGLQVRYTTVHIPENQRPFDYAVAASMPAGQEEYEIAVSDDVPEQLRGLWALHEYHDFKVLGFDAEDRCLQSEMAVVEQMDDSQLLQEYISYRLPFYRSLAAFMANDISIKGDGSEYDKTDVEGCLSAIDYLATKAS